MIALSPTSLRKQFGYQDGMEFFIDTDESGIIKFVPMMDVLKVHDWHETQDKSTDYV